MPALTPATYEVLAEVARAADAAGHGGRTAVYREAAQRLGISVPTLLGRLRQVRVAPPRKRRADAGRATLSQDEAHVIAAAVEETRRQTKTGELRLEQVVETLRSEGKIAAGRVDSATGEFTPLSLSAIRRALALHHCHPAQLAQPTAAVALRSEHPNHYWQVDASVCRQWYLADDGAEVMHASVYYRGKPANFTRINDRRLIRYAVTDHTSGHILLTYVLRAESAANAITALIHAMTPKDGIAMHGLPRMLGCDKGTESALLASFCAALDIRLEVHGTDNPRALGSGECAHNLIETSFEAAMKLRAPVTSLEEMNRCAAQWCRWFNGTRRHSRHGLTRRDAWLRITPAQLRLAPAPEVLQALATSAPKECTVRDLAIRYRGARWDVRDLPGVINGGKLSVGINPFDVDSVRVMVTGEDGRAAHFLAPRIQLDDWHFDSNGALVGQEYKSMPDTAVDAARKEIARLAMDATSDAEAKAARKRKQVAFGGALDPTRHWAAANLAPHIPRAGTPTQIAAPDVLAPMPLVPAPALAPAYVPRLLSHTEMALNLKHRLEALGATWTAATWARMTALWPAGVTEEQLDACAVQLLRGGLHLVGEAP